MYCKEIISDNNLLKDVFGPVEKQILAIKVWKKVFRTWLIKLEIRKVSPSGRQVHQLPLDQSASYAASASTAQTVDVPSSLGNSTSYVYGFG